MSLAPGTFVVADLNRRGELELKAEYRYEHLERIPGAAEMIGHLAGQLWRAPEEFEVPIPAMGPTAAAGGTSRLTFRWRGSSRTAGIATLRCGGDLTSVSLLACGTHPTLDTLTFKAFQQRLLQELHDTGIEPAFALMDLEERPLVATLNFNPPTDETEQLIAALADRCFAAAYFRYHTLA